MELTAPSRHIVAETPSRNGHERWPVSSSHTPPPRRTSPLYESPSHLPAVYVPPPPPPVIRRKWGSPRRCVAVPFDRIDTRHPAFPTRVLVPLYANIHPHMLAEALMCLRHCGWSTLLYTHPDSHGGSRSWEALCGLYDEVWDDWELFADATRGSRGINIPAELRRRCSASKTVVVIDAYDAVDRRVQRAINYLMSSTMPTLVIGIHRGEAPVDGLDYSRFDSVVTSRAAVWRTTRRGVFSHKRELSQDRINLMGRLSFDVPTDMNRPDQFLFRVANYGGVPRGETTRRSNSR